MPKTWAVAELLLGAHDGVHSVHAAAGGAAEGGKAFGGAHPLGPKPPSLLGR